MNLETARELVRASPPLTVTGLTILGVPVADWVAVVTLVYVILQMFFLVKDRLKGKSDGRN